MELSIFIQDLITEGKVAVKGELISFTEEDSTETKEILHKYYLEDVLEMYYQPPAFSAEAALWAAKYFYTALQLTIIRDAGEEVIEEQLKMFPGNYTAETIYSADLVFRYLPSLFELAKGLAPADILVEKLKKMASLWPFSSVGIELDEMENEEVIFSNPSLKQTYTDRIIEKKDRKRLNDTSIIAIQETAGEYIVNIWPEFESVIKK